MGLRWRKDGRLVCAAMTIVEPGDVYFDDRQLEVMAARGVILPDPDHFDNGLWHWAGQVVPDWNRMREKPPSAREDAGTSPASAGEATDA